MAAARGQFFDDCLPLLEEPRLTRAGADYPRVTGHRGGREIRLAAVVDTLGVRKLPSLWVLVTVAAPVPVAGIFDLMMRPSGTEAFSNFHRLEHTLATPPSWPAGAVLRSDSATPPLPPALLDAEVGFFREGRAKELLITSQGVRLVWLAAEAERGWYGLFRQARFANAERFGAEICRDLIERTLAIRGSILSAAPAT